MNVMKLTTKAQFTLNKPLLDHMGAKAGDHVMVKKQPDGSLRIQPTNNFVPLHTLQGCIETDLNHSDADIQQAIMRGYIKHGTSGLENER